MKKIITLNDYSAKQFPAPQDYEQVAELLRQDISSATNIVAATFTDSCASGNLSRLRGIDLALAYKGSITLLPKSLARALRVANERKLTVSILPIGSGSAVDKRGRIDPANEAAIVWFEEQGGAIKGRLSEYVYSCGEPITVVQPYIFENLCELTGDYLGYKNLSLEEKSQALTRTLYSVITAARLICFASGSDARQSFASSNAELARTFSQYGSKWCTHWLEIVIGLDRDYDAIMDRDSIDPSAYSGLRKRIQEAIPGSIDFMQRNLSYTA